MNIISALTLAGETGYAEAKRDGLLSRVQYDEEYQGSEDFFYYIYEQVEEDGQIALTGYFSTLAALEERHAGWNWTPVTGRSILAL